MRWGCWCVAHWVAVGGLSVVGCGEEQCVVPGWDWGRVDLHATILKTPQGAMQRREHGREGACCVTRQALVSSGAEGLECKHSSDTLQLGCRVL